MTPHACDIGATLREARERRGLSIRDIATVTKISPQTLAALERDDFGSLPGGLFRRAYIRAFAAEVGLDANGLAAAYTAQFEVEPEGGDDVAARPMTGARRRAVRWLAVVAAGLVMLICGVIVLRFSP